MPAPDWKRQQMAERRALRESPEHAALVAAAHLTHERARARGKRMQVEMVGPETDHVTGMVGPGAIVTGLEVGEPVFVVRARDAIALGFLAQYVSMATQADLFDGQRKTDLLADLQAFTTWRRANADRVRDPD